MTANSITKPVEAEIRLLRPHYGDARVLQGFAENALVYKRFRLDGHNGLDLGLIMQPVLAAHDGIVEFAGDGGEWPMLGSAAGIGVLLLAGGYRTEYAHLHKAYVRTGDPVKAGDVIGISGDTGATTGFHLHFGLLLSPYTQGNGYAGRTDPTPYLHTPTAGGTT